MEQVDKKFSALPKINTFNVAGKSEIMDEKYKPVSTIYDGQYFEIVLREGETLIVRCNMCGADGPQLRASTKSNGNILKHIQRRHPGLMETIKSEKNIKSRTPRFIKQNKKKRFQIKQESDMFTQQSDSQLEIAYTEVDGNENDLNLTEDELHDENNIAQGATLLDEGKHASYQNPEQDLELQPDEEAMIEDNYDRSYSKASEVEVFEHEMPYEQNGTEQQGTRSQRHFQSSIISSCDRLRYDKELIEFQKQLMQKEFDEVRAMRQEKHKLEIQILTAELKHKFIEHQKQLEFLNKRVLHDL